MILLLASALRALAASLALVYRLPRRASSDAGQLRLDLQLLSLFMWLHRRSRTAAHLLLLAAALVRLLV